MHQQALQYDVAGGWSAPLPTHLDSPQTLILAFAAPEFLEFPEPFVDLAGAFKRSVVIGCSTSGEIAGDRVNDASISVAIVQFEHTRLRHAITSIESGEDSFGAGARLAEQLLGDDLRAVFMLSDGLGVNGTPLVEGLATGLPKGVAITGGLAGDGSKFARTWVLDRDMPRTGKVCAVGLYGHRLAVGHGCDAGWSDFGPERRITRAEGNLLFELDGKPALELYKTYLGELAQGLPGTALLFPLAVRKDEDDPNPLVRTILAVDEASQSMTFAGDLPQGGIARLMRANTDHLIDSAGNAARKATQALLPAQPALIVSVSCVGRRLVLGERTEEELETVLEGVPDGSAHVGFYSYGEISPAVPGGLSELHNQTMTVTSFSEV